MNRGWDAWVALWDRSESPTALALVRIGVGLVVLVDLLQLAVAGMVTPMFAAPPEGYAALHQSWATTLLGTGASAAVTLWLVAVIAAACITLGLATRVACVVFLLVGVQLAYLAPDADRGIQMILRVVIAILAVSLSHAQWSLDAWIWRRLGRPLPTTVPAWPRYLLLLQILWIYFGAGINKSGAEWGPLGGFAALANAACDPNTARFACDWVAPVMPLTRIATALSISFELSAPLYLVFVYCAATADGTGILAGRLRRIAVRLRLRWVWIALGVAFHLGIALLLRIGAFPWGMLALYPALLLPSDLERLRRR